MSISGVFEMVPPGEICTPFSKNSSAEEVAFFEVNGNGPWYYLRVAHFLGHHGKHKCDL